MYSPQFPNASTRPKWSTSNLIEFEIMTKSNALILKNNFKINFNFFEMDFKKKHNNNKKYKLYKDDNILYQLL